MTTKLHAKPAKKETIFGNIVVSDDLGLAYMGIPKAGNTSMKKWLAPAFGVEIPDKDPIHIHDRAKFPFNYRTNQWLAKNASSYFIFTVVRHPVDRLKSAFRDKIQRDEVHTPLKALGFENTMDFDDFVAHASTIPDDRADVHIRGQMDILTSEGRFLPNLWVDLSDIKKMQSIIKSLSPSLDGTIGRDNVTKRAGFDVSKKTENLVRTRYEDDYTFFGFS